MSQRFAVYLAPAEGSALETFARSWLGRDHVTGAMVDPIAVEGIEPSRLFEITASPRHYGFHATMKAPFALAAGVSFKTLKTAAAAFAAKQAAFEIELAPANLKGFLALVPAVPSSRLQALADDCVRDFEPFREALSEADIARRRRSSLSARQDAQMLKWGYPYVFEDFHFHMTLTQRLGDDERDLVLAQLKKLTCDCLSKPFLVQEIAIYGQDDRQAPFTLRARLPFGG